MLIMFLPIFVADTKIVFHYDFGTRLTIIFEVLYWLIPAGIYLTKLTIETLEQDVKYV